MQTQEMKLVLVAKLGELSHNQIRREDIAIEKTAEEMDSIQQSGDRVLALDSLTRKWTTTTLIAEALKRIDDNTYGVCAECDEQISAKRLAAIPWAKYCISCQEMTDKANTEIHWESAA